MNKIEFGDFCGFFSVRMLFCATASLSVWGFLFSFFLGYFVFLASVLLLTISVIGGWVYIIWYDYGYKIAGYIRRGRWF